ncbi:MAG: lysozyme [Candidatus Liberibacter ctenarytainae]|uniref:Lysozyme n=1 Tax=Candidatus Liberibacter ctenarytainae TaxID=2020335 RepID=A0A937AKA7_9HYPH|nr:lysozyme [Candidatus Liberibacter ctenarytainae]
MVNVNKRFEGLRLKAYCDSENILTVSYGHTGADVFEDRVKIRDHFIREPIYLVF